MGQAGGVEISARQTGLKISIVTPTLNRGDMIEMAVQSVAAQHYPNIEHLIVDGGSSDDTLKRLSRYPHLRIVSESDRGLYDAYNKGVRLASGDVIGFLNDDDYYEVGVFGDIADAFQTPIKPHIVCGWSSGVRTTAAGALEYGKEVQERPSERLTMRTLNLDPSETMLNARFFDKSIFGAVGNFDTRYAVGADWDFMIRVAMHAPRIRYVPKVIHRYREHEQQLSFGHDPERTHAALQERLTILENLQTTSTPRVSDRRALRRLHSSVTLSALGSAMVHGWRGRAGTYVLRGSRYDPLFLWRLSSRFASRLSRRSRGEH